MIDPEKLRETVGTLARYDEWKAAAMARGDEIDPETDALMERFRQALRKLATLPGAGQT